MFVEEGSALLVDFDESTIQVFDVVSQFLFARVAFVDFGFNPFDDLQSSDGMKG